MDNAFTGNAMPESGVSLRIIVVGVSAGGVSALKNLLGQLPADFPLPILIVQHLAADSDSDLAHVLEHFTALHVKEAEECEMAQAGTAYLAPPNYHLLVERDGSLSLSTDPPVSFARPSVDVLFESAAEAFGPAVAGVILTGANADGSGGLQCIKACGGIAIVQNPQDAEVDSMPRAALAAVNADYVVALAELGGLLQSLVSRNGSPDHLSEQEK